MTIARLNGLFDPEFAPEGRQRLAVGSPASSLPEGRMISIADARALQAGEDLSEASFFERHSFVLLPHPAGVRDWDEDAPDVYTAEIDRLVRDRLLPARQVEVAPGPLLRRGRGTRVPVYAEGVHSDGGVDLEDHIHNIEAFAGREAARRWRERFDRAEVAGFLWIGFWRPTNMAGPLEHMPLALCDADGLDPADLVPTAMTGIAPGGRPSHHLSLRYNPRQRWYHYPRMACDEVIAFKQAEFWKDPAPPRNCFHSAFRHPDTDAHAEERQSCEVRVGVVVLNA